MVYNAPFFRYGESGSPVADVLCVRWCGDYRGAQGLRWGLLAGLGGGMGGFVVKPLQEELAEACQHDKALADARRCLEVLVPLAYRPAIKVCSFSMHTSP